MYYIVNIVRPHTFCICRCICTLTYRYTRIAHAHCSTKQQTHTHVCALLPNIAIPAGGYSTLTIQPYLRKLCYSPVMCCMIANSYDVQVVIESMYPVGRACLLSYNHRSTL